MSSCICPHCGGVVELAAGAKPRRARARAPEPAPAPARKPITAAELERVAASLPASARFGEKVFLAPLLEHFGRTPQEAADELAALHREGAIELARADLVQAMPPELVQGSEIAHLNARYHFLRPRSSSPAPAPHVHARDLVLAKVSELAGGRRAERVQLADLRDALPELDRATVDRELLALQQAGTLVLYRNDNTASLTARDRAAELLIAGNPRHLVLLDQIPTPAPSGTPEERILGAFDELERTDRTGLYSLADVRRRSGLPKAEFDRTVLQLGRQRVLTLHFHDYPASLSAAARAELVVDRGTHYHAGARNRSSSSSSPDAKARVLAAFEELEQGRPAGTLVKIADVRRRVPSLSRAQFDDALNALRRDWVLTGAPFEGRHEKASAADIDGGLDDDGRRLFWIARRSG